MGRKIVDVYKVLDVQYLQLFHILQIKFNRARDLMAILKYNDLKLDEPIKSQMVRFPPKNLQNLITYIDQTELLFL